MAYLTSGGSGGSIGTTDISTTNIDVPEIDPIDVPDSTAVASSENPTATTGSVDDAPDYATSNEAYQENPNTTTNVEGETAIGDVTIPQVDTPGSDTESFKSAAARGAAEAVDFRGGSASDALEAAREAFAVAKPEGRSGTEGTVETEQILAEALGYEGDPDEWREAFEKPREQVREFVGIGGEGGSSLGVLALAAAGVAVLWGVMQ